MSIESNDDRLLEELYRQEEDDMVVLSIREEIMNRVMEECYQKYIKRQTLSFIVQCARDALVKYMSLQLYYHPEVTDAAQPMWQPDEPIKPSPKDTWACNAVPIAPRNVEDHGETGTTVSICEESLMNDKCCMCLEHVCTCLETTEEIYRKFEEGPPEESKGKVTVKSRNVSTVDPRIVTEAVSIAVPSLVSSIVSSAAETIEHKDVEPKTKSFQTTTAKESQMSNNKAALTKGLKLQIPETIHPSSQVNVLELPPIRLQSTFQYKPVKKTKEK